MNQKLTIKEPLANQPQRLQQDAKAAFVEFECPQSITVRVKHESARGMIVFDLERPEGAGTYAGMKPMPYALKVEGDGGDIFTMHGLVSGDVLRVGRELSGGTASVELAGMVEATGENCRAYCEAFGIKVTPHPILGLPALS